MCVVCVVLCVCVCVCHVPEAKREEEKKKKKMGLLERHNKFYSGGLLFLLPTFVYLLS